MESKSCITCGAEFEAIGGTFTVGGRIYQLPPQLNCDACCAAYDAKIQSLSTSRQIANRTPWASLCPASYQGFTVSLLPEAARCVAGVVLLWSPSPRGIGLSGASRSGKTFILTELMRLRYEAGDSVHMPTAGEFAYAVGSGHDGDRREMIGKCLSADCLFVDDIGNARYTDRVEKDLFHVLETRKRNLKPVFCTVNGKGADLEASLSEHTARPIVNRLRHDVCQFYSIQS
jgi:DNA replication protein DnaC